jgi:hypothetical protein
VTAPTEEDKVSLGVYTPSDQVDTVNEQYRRGVRQCSDAAFEAFLGVLTAKLVRLKFNIARSQKKDLVSWIEEDPKRRILLDLKQLTALFDTLGVRHELMLARLEKVIERFNSTPATDGLPPVQISAYGLFI